MKVILLERVEKLGLMGDMVTVKEGYGRNFLLPMKKALRASEKNIEYFKTQKLQLEATNVKRKAEAEAIAEKMKGLSISLVRQASETGQLYGSVRPQDIANEVEAKGYKISRTQVALISPIKMLGIHKAHIILHPEVNAFVTVIIAQTEEEALIIAEGQKNTEDKKGKETLASEESNLQQVDEERSKDIASEDIASSES